MDEKKIKLERNQIKLVCDEIDSLENESIKDLLNSYIGAGEGEGDPHSKVYPRND